MANCIVFVSGKGSNLIKIHEHLMNTRHKVVGVVSDMESCGGANFAQEKHIPLFIANYSLGRMIAEKTVLDWIEQLPPTRLLVLAGFMRILSESFLLNFQGNIINIHPTLLPKYPGNNGLVRSIESGDDTLGITIHFVDKGVDTGPIILQESFVRSKEQTFQELEEHIHHIEHRLYPQVVNELLSLDLG